MIKLPPLSLYIHIPWCEKKCFYCDFNSYSIKTKIPQKKYINHLLEDLRESLPFVQNRTINSIFIGGGTPSLFDPKYIKMLILNVKNIVKIKKEAEITIESNPNTIELEKFLEYTEIGINRFSIGIQTFNSYILKKIGRVKQQTNSIFLLKKNQKKTFKNLNIDIIHSLPNQSYKSAIHDIKRAILINPSHISWYELTIEPHTFFYYNKPNKLINEKIKLKIIKKGQYLLSKCGYEQYETSSFSKPGFQCTHNKNYWKFGDYLGIGCGSHGKITKPNGDIFRIIKNKKIYKFMNKSYVYSIKKIKNENVPIEYFMNRLRLFTPISKKNFLLYSIHNFKKIKKSIHLAIQQGLLSETPLNWKITNKGKMLMNNLLELFLY